MMLEAKNLTFYYRNRKHAPVIDHFDLTVAPGERVGLTGPKGVCPVQMIWQHPEAAVDPLLRLGDTLKEAGEPDKRILEELRIRPEWMDRFPSELSGGELQRFCLARALRPETAFLLCDEITAMLDLVSQAQIWEFLIRESGKRGMGMLVVSHSGALLEKVCTRVVRL